MLMVKKETQEIGWLIYFSLLIGWTPTEKKKMRKEKITLLLRWAISGTQIHMAILILSYGHYHNSDVIGLSFLDFLRLIRNYVSNSGIQFCYTSVIKCKWYWCLYYVGEWWLPLALWCLLDKKWNDNVLTAQLQMPLYNRSAVLNLEISWKLDPFI